MKKNRVPLAITSLRIIAVPVLIFSFNQEIKAVTYLLFLVAVFSDFLDGYVAKKYEITSQLGAYFDVIADFLFVSVMFLVFVSDGLYPFWIVLLICIVFGQFILTSIYFKKTSYDPIGKYYGSLMYGGIGLTLLFSEQLVHNVVTGGIVVSTLISLVTRAVYFCIHKKENEKS